MDESVHTQNNAVVVDELQYFLAVFCFLRLLISVVLRKICSTEGMWESPATVMYTQGPLPAFGRLWSLF